MNDQVIKELLEGMMSMGAKAPSLKKQSTQYEPRAYIYRMRLGGLVRTRVTGVRQANGVESRDPMTGVLRGVR